MPLPVILVDFDHTLYNSRRYLRAMSGVLSGEGVQWRSFLHNFERYTSSDRERPLVPRDFFNQFYPSMHSAAELERFIASSSGQYLYRDALAFLRRLSSLPVTRELVTFADRESREKQIHATGIAAYFDKINIFEGSPQEKVDYIRERSDASPSALLVDDHPAILSRVANDKLQCVHLRRRIYRRYAGREPPMPSTIVVKTLKAAYAEIRAWL